MKGKVREGGFCAMVVLVVGGLRWCLVVEFEDGLVGCKEREKGEGPLLAEKEGAEESVTKDIQ